MLEEAYTTTTNRNFLLILLQKSQGQGAYIYRVIDHIDVLKMHVQDIS